MGNMFSHLNVSSSDIFVKFVQTSLNILNEYSVSYLYDNDISTCTESAYFIL
jgi:hypothetical protein